MTTTTTSRRAVFRLAAASAIAVALSASVGMPHSYAAEPSKTTVALNVDPNGVMLKGYDPVAYFTDGKALKGSEQFSAEYEGARYNFASAAHKDLFLKDPAKYMPAYGGFCAMGAVFDKKLDGDPTLWKIVDGRLYVNVNADAAKKWAEDVPGNIEKANIAWPKIKDVPAKELNAR